jgi:diguanylate cyclase (GGDEF)-like protein
LKVARRLMKMMVLFFIDIDGMKGINDTLGHPAGDRALTETADILRGSLRESDIIARIGGDEFAVFSLEGANPDVEGILSRISENIARLNSAEGRPFALSLSIGVARYSHVTSLSVEEMLAEADRAMYEEKRSKQKTHPASQP